MHEELGKFEPRFAAALKRDLKQTVPQSVSSCKGIQRRRGLRSSSSRRITV